MFIESSLLSKTYFVPFAKVLEYFVSLDMSGHIWTCLDTFVELYQDKSEHVYRIVVVVGHFLCAVC